ncbi:MULTISPECIES: hypothetical protein [unclassified Microcoleus]|uniref:hypothetical protein n=1 Tax=unclassified Microcoleus TaxID=2642155 RepID=UPI0025D4C90F|nr:MULTISPECIES: hypothetical protein [unclassified Microcoleus]
MKNNSQSDRQKFIHQAIAIAFILQAVIIGVKGNLDIESGKPALDVIQGMLFHGIELIVKANRSRKSVEKIDRPYQRRITPNSDD